MNRKVFVDLAYMTAGAFVAAVGVSVFLVPNRIVTGGLTGLSTIIYYLLQKRVSLGTLMLAMNLILFIVAYKVIDKKTVLRSVYGMLVFSAAVDMTKELIGTYLNSSTYNSISGDLLLCSLFGGALLGIGIGIIISRGGTTGGTDFIAKIITNFYPRFNLSRLIMIIDGIIISIATLVFRNILFSLYGIITVVVLSRLVSFVLEKASNARAAFIISEYPEEISQCILRDLDCGLTVLYGKRGYRGEDTEVLMCVYYKNIVKELHERIISIDSKAFIIHTDISEVFGRGFTLRR